MRLILWRLGAGSTIPTSCPSIVSWYFSLCHVPTTCCSSLHFWTMFGQDFFGAVDHPSLGDGGSTASVVPSHAETSNTLSLATSSSSWSSFYHSWVAGNISRMQLLDYATTEYADKYLRGMVVVPLSSWTPLKISTSPTVPLPSTSTIAGSRSVASSSKVRLWPARSRLSRRSECPHSGKMAMAVPRPTEVVHTLWRGSCLSVPNPCNNVFFLFVCLSSAF